MIIKLITLLFLSLVQGFIRSPHKTSIGKLSIYAKSLPNSGDTPKAVKFAGVKFSPPLSTSLQRLNIVDRPSPIQQASISQLCKGQSCLLHAPTGSGKTFAYLLPALKRIYEDESSQNSPLKALIVVPTKELSSQVLFDIEQLTNFDQSIYTHLTSPNTPIFISSKDITQPFTPNPALTKPLWITGAKELQEFIRRNTRSTDTIQHQQQGIQLMKWFQNLQYIVFDEIDRLFIFPSAYTHKKHLIHDAPVVTIINFMLKCKYLGLKAQTQAQESVIWSKLLQDVQLLGVSATINRQLRREVSKLCHVTDENTLVNASARSYDANMFPIIRPSDCILSIRQNTSTLTPVLPQHRKIDPILAFLDPSASPNAILYDEESIEGMNTNDNEDSMGQSTRFVHIPRGIHHIIQVDSHTTQFQSLVKQLTTSSTTSTTFTTNITPSETEINPNTPSFLYEYHQFLHLSKQKHQKHALRDYIDQQYPWKDKLQVLLDKYLYPAKQWLQQQHDNDGNDDDSDEEDIMSELHKIKRCILFVSDISMVSKVMTWLQDHIHLQHVYTLAMFGKEIDHLQHQAASSQQSRKKHPKQHQKYPFFSDKNDNNDEQKESEITEAMDMPLPSDEPDIFVLPMTGIRGLHIPQVDTIFLLDMPKNVDTYLHVAGRTNRMDCYSSSSSSSKPLPKKVITMVSEEEEKRMVSWQSLLQVNFEVLLDF